MCGSSSDYKETKFDVGDQVMYEGRVVEIIQNDHSSLPYEVEWVDDNGDELTDWAYEEEVSQITYKYSLGQRVRFSTQAGNYEGQIVQIDADDDYLTYKVSYTQPSGRTAYVWRSEDDLSVHSGKFKVGDQVRIVGVPYYANKRFTVNLVYYGSHMPYRLVDENSRFVYWARESEVEAWVAPRTLRFKVGDRVRILPNNQSAPEGEAVIDVVKETTTGDGYDYYYTVIGESNPFSDDDWGVADQFVEASKALIANPSGRETQNFILQWRRANEENWQEIGDYGSLEQAQGRFNYAVVMNHMGSRTYRIVERKSVVTEIVIQEATLTIP